MKIAYVDGPRLRRAFLAASRYVQGRRAETNRINVFPVPDGDTGSNLALTVQAVSARLEGVRERDVSTVSYQVAEATVLGARGNCGMMLSQVLLGFAEHLQGQTKVCVCCRPGPGTERGRQASPSGPGTSRRRHDPNRGPRHGSGRGPDRG